jgi:ribonuclease HI
MEHTARVIAEITGCTAVQTEAVIKALIGTGWTPPTPATASPLAEATVPATALSLDNLPAGSLLTVHTDGACSGNPGPGGWSVVFDLDGTAVAEFSGSSGERTTNNRMELTAVREAIRRAPAQARLEIVTDSKVVIGWLDQGFKRNDPSIAVLCREIDELRATRATANGGTINFKYVRGHNGDPMNERADQLARAAIKRT